MLVGNICTHRAYETVSLFNFNWIKLHPFLTQKFALDCRWLDTCNFAFQGETTWLLGVKVTNEKCKEYQLDNDQTFWLIHRWRVKRSFLQNWLKILSQGLISLKTKYYSRAIIYGGSRPQAIWKPGFHPYTGEHLPRNQQGYMLGDSIRSGECFVLGVMIPYLFCP